MLKIYFWNCAVYLDGFWYELFEIERFWVGEPIPEYVVRKRFYNYGPGVRAVDRDAYDAWAGVVRRKSSG